MCPIHLYSKHLSYQLRACTRKGKATTAASGTVPAPPGPALTSTATWLSPTREAGRCCAPTRGGASSSSAAASLEGPQRPRPPSAGRVPDATRPRAGPAAAVAAPARVRLGCGHCHHCCRTGLAVRAAAAPDAIPAECRADPAAGRLRCHSTPSGAMSPRKGLEVKRIGFVQPHMSALRAKDERLAAFLYHPRSTRATFQEANPDSRLPGTPAAFQRRHNLRGCWLRATTGWAPRCARLLWRNLKCSLLAVALPAPPRPLLTSQQLAGRRQVCVARRHLQGGRLQKTRRIRRTLDTAFTLVGPAPNGFSTGR